MKEIIRIQQWLAEKGYVIVDWNYSPNEYSLTTHFLVNKNNDCVFIALDEDLEGGRIFTLENFVRMVEYVIKSRELKL